MKSEAADRSPWEEQRLSYSVLDFSCAGKVTLVMCVICTIIAMSNLPFNPEPAPDTYGWLFKLAVTAGIEEPVTWDQIYNRTWNETALQKRLPFTPEQLAKLNNPQKSRHERIWKTPEPYMFNPNRDEKQPFVAETYRVYFGTSIRSLCKLNFPSGPTLPSVLRSMELWLSTQLPLRLELLLTISVRWFAVVARGRLVATHQRCSPLYRFLAGANNVVFIVESMAAFIVSLVHQDLDNTLRFLIAPCLMAYSVLSFLDMLIYSTLDFLAKSSSFLSLIRLCCAVAVLVSTPIIFESRVEYLHMKICTAQVPVLAALAEYTFMAAQIVFSLLIYWDVRFFTASMCPLTKDLVLAVPSKFVTLYKPVDEDHRVVACDDIEGKEDKDSGSIQHILNDYACFKRIQ